VKKRVKNEPFKDEVQNDSASKFVIEQYVSKGDYVHFHRELEIYGVIRGNVTISICGERKILCDGQAAVIGSLESHSYTVDGEAEIFCIHIGMKYLRNYFLECPDKQLPRWLMDREYNKIIFEHIGQMLKSKDKLYSELRRYGFVCELFADIIECYGLVEKKSMSVHEEDLMSEIIQYIYQHYNEKITLNSLSEKFFISPKTLSKKISKCLNVDLRVFINDIRVHKAILMMEDPKNKDKTLNEITELCGFDNIRTFYRCYDRNFKI